jgi:hypothetical protein
MASAAFTVNGGSSPQTCAAGSLVTLALTSTTGVGTVTWSIIGSSDSSKVAPTITPTGSPNGATATFTMNTPVGSVGLTWLVRCVINGGVDSAGQAVAAYTATAVVGVVNSTGILPFAFGESLERNAVTGIANDLNTAMASSGAGTTGPVATVASTFSTTAGNVDATVYTIPASPSGAGRFVLSVPRVRLNTAIVGTGNVTVTVGIAAGGTEYVLAVVLNNATAVGIVAGLALSTYGTALLIGNGYQVDLAAGATITVRWATAGTISAGAGEVAVFGQTIP